MHSRLPATHIYLIGCCLTRNLGSRLLPHKYQLERRVSAVKHITQVSVVLKSPCSARRTHQQPLASREAPKGAFW